MKMSEIQEIPAEKFVNWIAENFYKPVPSSVDTYEDAVAASKLLAFYANGYAYLCQVHSCLKITARTDKRLGHKERAEDYADKRDIAEEMSKVIKQCYQAVSRMLTVRQNNLDELNMSENR